MSHPLFDLSGKTALITGSSRGLGRAIAEGLAQAGARLVINGTQAERTHQAQKELQAKGYAVGLDMTRRDLQDEAKQLRRPWDAGKSSDLSGPCGPLYPVAQVGHPSKGFIRVSVDGVVKQSGDLSDMIWSVAEQISILSHAYRLEAGDVIFSGTPDGVGPVTRGQVMKAEVEGLGAFSLKVV